MQPEASPPTGRARIPSAQIRPIAQHRALAERHREADRVGVLAHRGPPPPLPPTSSSLTDSRKRLDQISCPASRTRPKTRAIGAPSLDPITRNRSTRPVSTGSEPVPSSRWSIAEPSVAPIALPSTAVPEPGDARRRARRRAPSRRRTTAAWPSAAPLGKAEDPGDPPRPGRRQRRLDDAVAGIGMDQRRMPERRPRQHADVLGDPALAHPQHRRTSPGRASPAATGDEVPRRRRQQVLGAARLRPVRRCRPAPPPARRPASRARARAAARGSRSPRRGSSPGAGRACRSTPAPARRSPRRSLSARGWLRHGPLRPSDRR